MLFSSLVFLWFFLPAAVFLYYLAPGRNAKNIVLFAAASSSMDGADRVICF